MSHTKLVIIGGGPGGYAAAFLAADLGLDVTLVGEDANPGGVCLYRGCIPSKALLHVAALVGETRHASAWGVEFGEPTIDLAKLRGWKESVVQKLTGGLGQLARQRKVRYVRGRATLQGPTSLTIDLADGGREDLTFATGILATGSRPATIPGLSIDSPRVMDSTTALEVPDVPKTLLVVGGGYIGLELGSVYAALGTKVSVVEMTGGLLPGADRDLVAVLAKRMEKVCEAIMLNTRVTGMTEEQSGMRVTFTGEGAPAELVFDKVLVSIGRRPNSNVPGLEKTRVEVDRKGFIVVDAQRRTAEPTLYAIGDVAGEPMLAHKASHEGRAAVEAIAGHKVAFEPLAIPAVVFTDPEIAWCGLTETQAAAERRTVEVVRFPWGASGRATTLDRNDGVTKFVLEPGTGRVLGMGIAGVHAGEMIAEGVLAIEMGATADDVRLTIHPHPTLSETIMEAADVFFGQSTHVYRPRKKA